MTLTEFYDELERHDWFTHFSDDHRVWESGEAAHSRLAEIAKESPEHKKLMDAFGEYHYSGSSFGKPKAPKPERPK